jgi:hypothetical protein
MRLNVRLTLFSLASVMMSAAAQSDTVALICAPGPYSGPDTSSHDISFDEPTEGLWIDGKLFEKVTFTRTVISLTFHADEWNFNRVSGAWRHHRSLRIGNTLNEGPLDESGICRVADKTQF